MEYSPKEHILKNLQIIGRHQSGLILEIALSRAKKAKDPSDPRDPGDPRDPRSLKNL